MSVTFHINAKASLKKVYVKDLYPGLDDEDFVHDPFSQKR